MDELIQKYLDGDLSEEEAAVFSRALADNPDLETELGAFEQALTLVSRSGKSEPSSGFTDGVMDRIVSGDGVAAFTETTVRGSRRVWLPRLAVAAGFAVVFALGYITANRFVATPSGPATEERAGTGVTALTDAEAPFRVARLIYVPQQSDVNSVSVAGTFNDWDPEGIVMRREGGAWVVQLMLPPQTYEYMFVENGERWITDPFAAHTRDDGFGRENAVLDLTI